MTTKKTRRTTSKTIFEGFSTATYDTKSLSSSFTTEHKRLPYWILAIKNILCMDEKLRLKVNNKTNKNEINEIEMKLINNDCHHDEIFLTIHLVDSFSDKWFPMGTNCAPLLADLFLYSYKMSFWINSLRKAKESSLESSIYHTVTSMTLSLLIIKDLRSSFPIFTPKNSQFLKPQNLLQLLLISICFSSEIIATI